MSTRLLVSVRSVVEAQIAARHGADFIDLKEPAQGALGGLPTATITAIVAALRDAGSALPVSATIGDLPMGAIDEIRTRVDAVAGCGVDIVKVGIERDAAAHDVLDALARSGHAIVPVFIADRGLGAALVSRALSLGFAGVMVDTADKRAGSLFDALPPSELHDFVARARTAGTMVGLAGALRLEHLPDLLALAPDFAGFRSAVCAGDRRGDLDVARLRALVQRMRRPEPGQPPGARTSPSSSERMRESSLR